MKVGLILLKPKADETDRRTRMRFPLVLDLRYHVAFRDVPEGAGSGRVIDMSSTGLRLTTQGPLEPGLSLDVTIDWPVLRDDHAPLQLIVRGNVVWSSGTEAALQIQQHSFRTREAVMRMVAGAKTA